MTGKKKPIPANFKPEVVKSLLDKVGREDRAVKIQSTISFENLYRRLTAAEALIHQLLALNPRDLGFRGPFVSLAEAPEGLVAIETQQYQRDDQKQTIRAQYLPQPAWTAFQKMAKAIHQDLGSRLMVESGYRSPAAQAVVFLSYLEMNKFDLQATAAGVALPGYSQHSDPVHTAVDVINQDGLPTDEAPQEFADTIEFRWLKDHASQFNFHLTYPNADNDGIKFEPWHWRYLG